MLKLTRVLSNAEPHMQKLTVRVSALTKPHAPARKATAVSHSALRLSEVWHAAIEAFITHAAPLLLLGVTGFAAAPLLSSALAFVAMPLARIAMTHIVAHGDLRSLRGRQLSAALVMAWVYAVAMMAGQLGISAPLRAWGLNLNFTEQRITAWDDAPQTLAMRSIHALSNETDLPFKDELRIWRNRAFDEWVQPDASFEKTLMISYWQHGPDAASGDGMAGIEAQVRARSSSRPDLRLIFLGGVMLIFVAETLLAFRSLMGVKPTRLLWLNLKHFGTVAGHLWLLRLVIVGLKVLFVFVPIVVVDRYSYLAHEWGWFGSATQVATLTICLACIDVIPSIFEAVYLAKLYLMLTTPTENP